MKLKNYFSLTVPQNRIWELDLLKGLAFLFMVWDHTVFDLSDFFGVNTTGLGFFQEGIGHISAAIFMVVCGISTVLGNHNLKHGAITFSLGMALTVGTFAAEKITGMQIVIWFGILHFLGISMIIGHFAKKLPKFVLPVLAAVSFVIGLWFENLSVNFDFLSPLGLYSPVFYSADYFPLFPNLCYTFIGIFIGKTLYKNKQSLLKFSPRKSILCNMGRHTLSLYFIHQPIVVAVLYICNIIFKFSS